MSGFFGEKTRAGRLAWLLALGFAFLLKALPLPPAVGQLDALLGNPHALCLGLGGQASDHGTPTDPGQHDCCDFCCLTSLRLAVLPPSDPVAMPLPDRDVELPAFPPRARQTRGPPTEAWSPDRAQRAPPFSIRS